MNDIPLVFSTRAYANMAQQLVDASGFDQGNIEIGFFPDGERHCRVATNVDGRDVVLLGGTPTDQDALEIFDIACGLVTYGARRLSVVMPYFGYSTMDRATKPGEIVTAKTRARLFSSIPPAAYGNRVFLVDLHTEGLQHYFEDDIRSVHIYAKPIITDAVRDVGGDDFVLACTDAGRAKWVESLANDLGVSASFVFKRRLDGERTEITGVSAQVDGRRVVIYDDMIRTGGSLIGAARAYIAAGATSVVAVTTHGVFPVDAVDRLRDSATLERIIVTDTHPRAIELASSFIEVRSVVPVLVDALRHSL